MDRPRIKAAKKIFPDLLNEVGHPGLMAKTIEELKEELRIDGVQEFIDPSVETWLLQDDPGAYMVQLSVDPYSRPEDW